MPGSLNIDGEPQMLHGILFIISLFVGISVYVHRVQRYSHNMIFWTRKEGVLLGGGTQEVDLTLLVA